MIIGSIVWDERKGEGRVKWAKCWPVLHVVVKLDALIDAQHEIHAKYREAQNESMAEWDRIRREKAGGKS